jgi:hypothetical protein
MMHQLTIDPSACRGITLCHACEALMPGLVNHCKHYGNLLISHENTAVNSSRISRLISECPDRAIMMQPLTGQPQP